LPMINLELNPPAHSPRDCTRLPSTYHILRCGFSLRFFHLLSIERAFELV
jgi:hypothetical protein